MAIRLMSGGWSSPSFFVKSGVVLAAGLIAAAAGAQVYTPTQGQLLDLGNVNYGGGGTMTSNVASSGGALLTMNFDAAGNTQGDFPRVALSENVSWNLSGYTELDVAFTNILNVTGATLDIQTGPTYAWNQSSYEYFPQGATTVIKFSLVGISDLDQVNTFGMQLYSGLYETTGAQVQLNAVPEPAPLCAVGLGLGMLVFRRRR